MSRHFLHLAVLIGVCLPLLPACDDAAGPDGEGEGEGEEQTAGEGEGEGEQDGEGEDQPAGEGEGEGEGEPATGEGEGEGEPSEGEGEQGGEGEGELTGDINWFAGGSARAGQFHAAMMDNGDGSRSFLLVGSTGDFLSQVTLELLGVVGDIPAGAYACTAARSPPQVAIYSTEAGVTYGSSASSCVITLDDTLTPSTVDISGSFEATLTELETQSSTLELSGSFSTES